MNLRTDPLRCLEFKEVPENPPAGTEHLTWLSRLSHWKWLKPRPGSGLDYLTFATFARQRSAFLAGKNIIEKARLKYMVYSEVGVRGFKT